MDRPGSISKAAALSPKNAVIVLFFKKSQSLFVSVILNPAAIVFYEIILTDFKPFGESCQIIFGKINNARRQPAAVGAALAFKGKSVFVKTIFVRQNLVGSEGFEPTKA